MKQRDRRLHSRRAKSIRLRFHAEGEEHRAVTTTVSPGGAFVKAAFVPTPGTTVTFREVYNHGARIFLRGEVAWVLDEPTLDRPDVGFGLRFIELFTQDDPGTLEEFLRYLDPGLEPPIDIQYEERPSGVFAVYRFTGENADDEGDQEAADGARTAKDAPGGDDLEDATTIDLANELARLEREQARTESPAAGSPAAPASEPAPAAPRPRERSRRRMVTGIFTALFSRRREHAEEGFEPGRERSQTPPIGATDKPAVHDARLPRVTLGWDGDEIEAGVKTLGGELAVLRAKGPGPPVEAPVRITPLDGGDEVLGLSLRGRVLAYAAGDADRGDEYTLLLDAPEGREQGQRLTAWLRHVNGPAIQR
jgi:hypothetical protein